MSKIFKWWIVVGVILNLILWPMLWRPEMDIIPQLLIGVGLNCPYWMFGLLAEGAEQIDRI